MSKFERFGTKVLKNKLALGEVIIELLESDNDPRAPDAIERLSAEMDEIRGVLADRSRPGQSQIVAMKPVNFQANLGG